MMNICACSDWGRDREKNHYRIPDIEKAKHWYREVLDMEPNPDSPVAVFFSVGETGLVLVPSANLVVALLPIGPPAEFPEARKRLELKYIVI